MARWGLRVAVVEPTSLAGRDVRAVLSERGFPVEKMRLLHAGTTGEGLLSAGDDDEPEVVAPLDPGSLDDCHVAFLCGSSDSLAGFLEARTDACLAIDLSGLRTGGPFVLPREESGIDLPPGNLYLTYHPTSFVLWEALRILKRLGSVSGVTIAVDRPGSELGRAALDELFRQAMAIVSFAGLPKEILRAQSAFNFYHPEDSGRYEERVREDILRLLGEDTPLSILSARAGVFHGHHLRIEARFDGQEPGEAEVAAALFTPGTGFVAPDTGSPAGPVESAGRDETLVLRLSASEGSVRLALASDHLRRGAAHLAVRLAEEAVRERGLLADA
jgi:aspartate-semialdehyde dehydrogenase